VAGYDEHLSVVTRQSIPVLLDAANIRAGARVLDVATNAGSRVALDLIVMLSIL